MDQFLGGSPFFSREKGKSSKGGVKNYAQSYQKILVRVNKR
jgi:hypothetical protein